MRFLDLWDNSEKADFRADAVHGKTWAEFVELPKGLIHRRKKPLHLVVDGLPAHKDKQDLLNVGGEPIR